MQAAAQKSIIISDIKIYKVQPKIDYHIRHYKIYKVRPKIDYHIRHHKIYKVRPKIDCYNLSAIMTVLVIMPVDY